MASEKNYTSFPHFATQAINVGQDPEQYNSKTEVPLISLSATLNLLGKMLWRLSNYVDRHDAQLNENCQTSAAAPMNQTNPSLIKPSTVRPAMVKTQVKQNATSYSWA